MLWWFGRPLRHHAPKPWRAAALLPAAALALGACALLLGAHAEAGLTPLRPRMERHACAMLAYVGFHAVLVVLLAGHLAARVAAGLLTPRQRATFDNTMLLRGCACAQGIGWRPCPCCSQRGCDGAVMEWRSHFFTLVWRTSSPLWLWAAHFTLCYAGVAVGCPAGWHETVFAGVPALHWMLGTASVAALVLAVVALGRACRRAAQDRGFAPRVQALSSGLALAGIAWNAVPLLLLPACRHA